MKANKLVMAVGCLMALGSVAYADVPPLPQLRFCGTINGSTAIWFDDDASSPANLWFQMKGADEDESAWRTVEFVSATDWHFKNVTMYNRPADFSGVVSFRVANTNDAGESAGWLAGGTLTNFLRQVGTPIGTRGNVATSCAFDGKAETLYESSTNYSGYGVTPWIGERFDNPVTITRVRYLPRPDATGRNRLKGDVFQCADTEDFADPVDLFTVPADVSISGVSEVVLERPVTARYFRFLHMSVSDNYISLSELELVPPGLPTEPTFSVACSDDWTNQHAKIDWLVPSGVMCPSAVVQRAVSPAGPFADLSPWVAAGVAGSFVDATAPVAVPYYYRLRMACDAAYLEHELFTAPVRYVRGRRLERDWADLSKVREGVTVLPPYRFLGYEVMGETDGSDKRATSVFDDNPGTFCELKYPKTPQPEDWSESRALNGAVGVDLGADYHIVGVAGYPREGEYVAARLGLHAVWGGSDSRDTNTWTRLSPAFNEKYSFPARTLDYKWYYMPTDDSRPVHRCVFLWGTKGIFEQTYCNVAEEAIFGYSDDDTEASGVTIPPTEISVSGVANHAVIGWDRAFNAAKNVVERRTAEGDWMQIAELDGDVCEFVDYGAPAGLELDYRVVSYGADEAFAYSPSVSATLPAGELPTGEISVSMDNWTNQAARLSWQTDGFGLLFPSGTVQRAVSPNGPFADIAFWTASSGEQTFVDEDAAVGVPSYYRLCAFCEDPLAEGREFVSASVFFRRSRRLDRDWNDLTKMRTGVSVMYPFAYLGPIWKTSSLSGVTPAFDGTTNTFAETYVYTNTPSIDANRCRNPEVGVDLGAPYHITALLAINRITPHDSILDRMRATAVFGANTAEQTDAVQLSPLLTAAQKNEWFYLPMADSTESYRYAYLREPVESVHWFGNIAEVGFFGWNEQDIVDSGVLVPPTEIAVVADTAEMTVSWNAGYNVASYLVQRRVAGTETWTDVATLPSTATSCTDGGQLKKGSYEYRVLTTGTDGTTGLTAVVGCYFEPKRGMLLIFR